MKQYESAFPFFRYLGAHPSDFMGKRASGECVTKCCTRDWTRTPVLYGAVINTDDHTGPGMHWVALLLDCRNLAKPVVYYYDSVVDPPTRHLNSFWKALLRQFKGSARQHLLAHSRCNTRAHQRSTTECGNFAMMCVDAVVRGVSFEDYCARRLDDRGAFEMRSVFFS
jgi:hypothetical protein